MIDTNVAIHLRDGDTWVTERLEALDSPFSISVVTQVELEGGVSRHPADTALRRRKLDELVASVRVLPFDAAEARAYGHIVAGGTYALRRIFDLMIAATAIANGARLITMNGDDFRNIAGLDLEIWEA